MNYVIHTENLSKFYGKRRGIEEVSLRVSEGRIFGFLGPNGAGKTTTIRSLLGLIRPTHGTARVFGRDCWRESARIKEDVGYLAGDLRLYSWMNVRNALRAIGQMRRRDITRTGMALAERFRLEPGVAVRNMSRGMRQKLGLILVLAPEPRLLVLDEPSSALDPPMQELLYTVLRERAAAGGTVFFSSHTLSEVDQLCDEVAIVRTGRLVAQESLQSLRERTKRLVTLHWRDGQLPADPSLPSCISVFKRDGHEWRAHLEGPSVELVQWAAKQPLVDMSIAPPDLDTLFRQFYTTEVDA